MRPVNVKRTSHVYGEGRKIFAGWINVLVTEIA
jgi:hypothetical protein